MTSSMLMCSVATACSSYTQHNPIIPPDTVSSHVSITICEYHQVIYDLAVFVVLLDEDLSFIAKVH